MKKTILFVVTLLLSMIEMDAAERLTLKDVTGGSFRGESMAAVQALSDGQTYAQLSADGKRVVKYSFKTGQEVGVLFDVATATGAKLDDIDGYTVSPDGTLLLIQTSTNRIYRHSHTATYYIYNIKEGSLVPLSRTASIVS